MEQSNMSSNEMLLDDEYYHQDDLEQEILNEKESAGKRKKAWTKVLIPVAAVLAAAGVVGGMFLSKHMSYQKAMDLLGSGKVADAVEIHQKLGDYKDLEDEICSVAQKQFQKYLDNESYSKARKIYSAVSGYPDAVKKLDKLVKKQLESFLEYGNMSSLREFWEEMGDDETVKALMEGILVEQAEKNLRKTGTTAFTVSLMNTVDSDALRQVVYEHALELADTGEYTAAANCFALLGDYQDSPAKFQENVRWQAVENLETYLNEGRYTEARELVDTYDGELHEQLLERFMAVCGDDTFLADLEAALLNRIYGDYGDYYKHYHVAQDEYEYLESYLNVPFYDTRLQELMVEYLDAVAAQASIALYWYESGDIDSYDFSYYWDYYAAVRYMTLDQLRDEYGFNPSDPEIQGLFDMGEDFMVYNEVWYMIHLDLASQLWGVGPVDNGAGEYVMYLRNYSGYTYSIYVWQEFIGTNGATVGLYEREYLSIAPGEEVQIVVGWPDDYVDYWYIDWDIYDIYDGNTYLG